MKKTGMVFGVFDGLHEGHRYFLGKAKEKADNLIVVVAVPETIQILKNRGAKRTLHERMSAVKEFGTSFTVVAALNCSRKI